MLAGDLVEPIVFFMPGRFKANRAAGGLLLRHRNAAQRGETATEIAKTFIEAIAAPDYDVEALAVLKEKKNLRLLKVAATPEELVVKSISGGYLAQTPDIHRLVRAELQVKQAQLRMLQTGPRAEEIALQRRDVETAQTKAEYLRQQLPDLFPQVVGNVLPKMLPELTPKFVPVLFERLRD